MIFLNKSRRIELIQRSLGIRHKLKVYESMKAPESHEELALVLLSKWELEDELNAIEEVLAEERRANVLEKKLALKDGENCLTIRGRSSNRKSVSSPRLQPAFSKLIEQT